MLIDLENHSTYPASIKDVIYQYIAENLTPVESQIKETTIIYDNDVRCAIENYLLPSKSDLLYQELLEIMSDNEIICYHATKLLNCQQILQNGLKTNNWDEYSVYMETALKALGITDTKEVIECIHKEYQRKYGIINRKPQVCFFSGLQMLKSDSCTGYDQFCQNIGGELARWALKDKMPKVYQLLKSNGIQFVIKFSLPFHDIAEYQKESILYQFVCYYAAKYFWNWNYTIEFDGATNKDITQSQVIELIQYRQEVNYE